MKKYYDFLILLIITLLFYLPIFKDPSIILERNNDLTGFFWPLFYFVKSQILENHTLPLWNNLFLSGTPLVSDPQSPLFYPPNIIFLFLPIGTAFIVSFLLHSFIGGIGIYLTAKYGFRFSKSTSLFTAIIYITSPKLASYLESGHFGLVASFAWLPFVILATLLLTRQPKLRWAIVLSISLAAIFYTHTITFTLTTIGAWLFFMAALLFLNVKHRVRSVWFFTSGQILAFGLSAVALLPQLTWAPHTTRFLLLTARDTYPQWSGVREFFNAIVFPWLPNFTNLWQLDSEKWITLGFLLTSLAIWGLLKIKRKLQIFLTILLTIILLISLNNSSPIYQLLIKMDWFALMRVATRVWFIPVLATIFLAGWGYENLAKKLNSGLLKVIAILIVIELVGLSWARLLKPVQIPQLAPQEIYQFLKQDQSRFRVFCINFCLSQKEAAQNNLQLLEGYNTLIQTNYYKHAWQLMGSYWNYYTLSLPPVGAYLFQELQPDSHSLSEYNVKYVISSHRLNDKNFVLKQKLENYLVYQNQTVLPRAYFLDDHQKPSQEAPILKFSPNFIRVDTTPHNNSRVVLAEVYSLGWQAYLNGQEKTTVQETPNSLRLVDIKPNTKFIDFQYQPPGFQLGALITLVTILFLIFLVFK